MSKQTMMSHTSELEANNAMDFSASEARVFANEWIESWNSHDLERILSHYSDEIEMTSSAIPLVVGASSGTLQGKPAVHDYWQRALKLAPDLHFELLSIFSGPSSLTLHYKGLKGKLISEVLVFQPDSLIMRGIATTAIED